MATNSTSFQPGKSGNPGGRPKGVRSLARLIDSLGDEVDASTNETVRVMMVRRLWAAAATGTLGEGQSSQQMKPNEWIRLVQWLVTHMDKVSIDQWAWQGQSQIRAEMAEEKAAAEQMQPEPDAATVAETVPLEDPLPDETEQLHEDEPQVEQVLASVLEKAPEPMQPEPDSAAVAETVPLEAVLPDETEQLHEDEAQVDHLLASVLASAAEQVRNEGSAALGEGQPTRQTEARYARWGMR